jgi:hypothetical protein
MHMDAADGVRNDVMPRANAAVGTGPGG